MSSAPGRSNRPGRMVASRVTVLVNVDLIASLFLGQFAAPVVPRPSTRQLHGDQAPRCPRLGGPRDRRLIVEQTGLYDHVLRIPWKLTLRIRAGWNAITRYQALLPFPPLSS